MDGLIVVHTESIFRYNKSTHRPTVYDIVFDKISSEIGQQLQLGNKVYYLGEESESPESDLIYPTIRNYFPNITYVEMDFPQKWSREAQYLRVKEQIMNEGIERVDIAGVLYQICVSDIYNLLSRKRGARLPKRNYRRASETMKLTSQKFEEIFNSRVEAEIREDLTDKLLNKFRY